MLYAIEKRQYVITYNDHPHRKELNMNISVLKRITPLLLAIFITTAFLPAICRNVHAASKPEAPRITSVETNGNRVTLHWNKVSGAKKYQVYAATGKGWKYVKKISAGKAGKYSDTKKYKLKKAGSKYKLYKKTWKFRKVAATANTSYVFKGKYSKRYVFKIRALSGKSKGKFSAVKKIYTAAKKKAAAEDDDNDDSAPTDTDDKTDVQIPGIVTGLKAVPDGNKILVSWNAVPGADHYMIYYRKNGSSNLTFKQVYRTSVRFKAGYGKTVFFSVRAVNDAGTGPTCKEISATTKTQFEVSVDGGATVLPFTASVSGDVITLKWNAASGAYGYDVLYGTDPTVRSIEEVDNATSVSIRGIYGLTYHLSLMAKGSKDVIYKDLEVTIPESNDPTPPERTYVDPSTMSTKTYLEKYVYPDVYQKFKEYNGSNTDEFVKLKNMLKAMHALCSYGTVVNNRFFKQVRLADGGDPNLRYIPPAHVQYAVGCESATMCMLYMCSKEGMTAYAYYPGHANPVIKANGVWFGSFADATSVLSGPGDDEELNLNGYYCRGHYTLSKQYTNVKIKSVFSLKTIFDLDYSLIFPEANSDLEKITLSTGISWGYDAEFANPKRTYTIDINKCKFAAIGGDTDIITFDNTNGTFSTHGTGTVTVQMTCGTWTDTFKVNIK